MQCSERSSMTQHKYCRSSVIFLLFNVSDGLKFILSIEFSLSSPNTLLGRDRRHFLYPATFLDLFDQNFFSLCGKRLCRSQDRAFVVKRIHILQLDVEKLLYLPMLGKNPTGHRFFQYVFDSLNSSTTAHNIF